MTVRAVPLQPARVEADPADLAAIGARLTAAREARGLSLAQCAERLSLPVQVLRRLERGALSPLDSGVYLRGHLRSYGALLLIDADTLDDFARRLAPEAPPPLVASGRVPSARYALERYLRAGISIALTIAIAAPLVWFAMQGDATRSGARLQPIDAAPVMVAKGPTVGGSRAVRDASSRGGQAPGAQAQPQPLLAAMTPFVSSEAQAEDAVAPPAMGGHTLALQLSAPSWVEVTTDAGKHLAYALLQPGSYSWSDGEPLHVLIGNAGAAAVTVDGKPFALKDISANNVARFSVGSVPGNA